MQETWNLSLRLLAASARFPMLFLAATLLPALSLFASPYGDATIRRDTYGIPHILAQNEKAASFALGYAQAEDHAVEIAKRFLAARGLAHTFDPAQREADFRIAQFRNVELSEQAYAKLPALYKGLVDSYIAGVNHFLAAQRATLPSWVPASFSGVDVIAHTRASSLAGIGAMANAPDLRTLNPPTTREPEGDPAPADLLAHLPDADGSNAFALHGSRTKSGRPILLGNPHLPWNSLYWEAHVTVPGKINFYGSTLPGIPVLRAGFNEHLGWVNTNNAPDLVDVFYFAEDPNKPNHYLYAGKSLPLTSRTATIAGQQRTFFDTHLGPVVRRQDKKLYVAQSAGIDAVRYYEGFYRLAKTKNLAEFKKVLALSLIPFSHFTYADKAGNIFYAWNARLPKRLQDGTDYTKPLPAEPKYLWKAFHSFSDYPSLLNPTGGYIMNSNDPPWYTNLQQRLDPANFPSYFERGDLRLRSQSILSLLNNDTKHDLDSAIAMKFNTRVLLADRIKADLIAALRAAPAEPILVQAAQVLEAWDNHVATTSKGALLFLSFFQAYSTKAKPIYATPFDPARAGQTPSGLGDAATAVAVMKQVATTMQQRLGALDLAYGDRHRFRFIGPDSRPVDLPADGASGIYGVYKVQTFAPEATSPDQKLIAGQPSADQTQPKPLAGFGDAWVIAVEFTSPLRATSVLSYGQTTNPSSKHCCDQIALFANHQLRPIWFTEAELKQNLEKQYQP